MGVLLPHIGTTDCSRAVALLENHSSNIVGTFWVMGGKKLDEKPIPDWWTNVVRKENQAQAILDAHASGCFSGGHNNPLYLGFCIIVVADRSNPASFSYVIQHLRMHNVEGLRLLKILARYNIPAHTEVTAPMSFINARYRYERLTPEHLKRIGGWTAQVWEDYCSDLLAVHGKGMTERYWSNSR